jgi:hypothetical protein
MPPGNTLGDNGILMLLGTAVAAVWLGRKVSNDLGPERPPLGAQAQTTGEIKNILEGVIASLAILSRYTRTPNVGE